MFAQLRLMSSRLMRRTGLLARDERGDFGIGQIAFIVAGIVIIGVIISLVTNRLPTWIDQLWDWVAGLFD